MKDELDNIFDVDVNDFDIDNDFLDDKKEINNTFFKPKKHKILKSHQVKFLNAQELVKKIDLKSKERVFSFVRGNFIFSDFLVAFFVHHDIKAERIDISTLSYDEYNIMALKELFEKGYINKLNLIISDYFYSHERNKKIHFAYETLKKYDFQIAVLRSHVKTITIKTDRGNKFTIHGSSNLRSSDNIEQFMIEQDKKLYDFHIEHNDYILKKYNTIRKPLTNKDI